jgi:uncharacterized protein (DUF433 family)
MTGHRLLFVLISLWRCPYSLTKKVTGAEVGCSFLYQARVERVTARSSAERGSAGFASPITARPHHVLAPRESIPQRQDAQERTMDQQEIRQNTPLILVNDGTIRMTGSRVSLEVIFREFKQGATAEQLLEDFPSLTLRDIYGAIYYYLDNTEAVEDYMRQQEDSAAETCAFLASHLDSAALRTRIRARHQQAVQR